jgi:predicted small metal-binding protein
LAFECAFMVEGWKEEELPEVIVGSGFFSKLDV